MADAPYVGKRVLITIKPDGRIVEGLVAQVRTEESMVVLNHGMSLPLRN
jgi:ribosomal protein L35AE/L33A